MCSCASLALGSAGLWYRWKHEIESGHFLTNRSDNRHCGVTQTLTQIAQNPRGAERNNLRVLGYFRSQKAWKPLYRSGRRNRRQLITRRSLVQVQPPQPQNRLISQEIRRFFFTFCLQKFPEKLRDFAKFAVDPNRDPDRAKNVPWRSPSAPRLSCCLGLFFRFQIAAVRTFSIVLAASFCAAVVTWA